MLPNGRRPVVRTLVLLAFLVADWHAMAASAAAQLPGAPAPSAAPARSEPPPEAPDSPRAALRTFLDLTSRRGDYQAAVRFLELPAGEESRGPELARRLQAVLERRDLVDLVAVSPAAEGDTKDGLPPDVDSLGHVPDGKGGLAPVYLRRARTPAGATWLFSRQTVARVDAWYESLPDRWVRERVPHALQRVGPGELMWWQWLALPGLLLLALLAGRLLGLVSSRVLRRITARTPTHLDDRLLGRVSPALTLLWSAAVAALLLPRLTLLPAAEASVRSLLAGAATFAVFWSLWRSVDVWAQFLMERPWALENSSARSLISVSRNLVKVFVFVGGAVATLAVFGYPVMTVLAGLGIGGIALAFGAQKTIENLFGSIAIAADQPFRVGDFVRIEDFTGTVERIGMRSTQVRTLDRTLVSLPNGKLADMRVEDFASRDRIRFTTTVSLVYGTTEAQLRQVIEGIERLLRSQAETWPDAVVSKLMAFGPSSLDIEVLCWYRTTDYDRFRVLRQEALLGILRIVQDAGTQLAFPTRTVRVVPADAGGSTATSPGTES